MTERPILFNGEMVRAILDGRKTQTRRIVKPIADAFIENGELRRDARWGSFVIPSPYGVAGDRIWVRETWCGPFTIGKPVEGHKIHYRATHEDDGMDYLWKPSIHMPRWASRLTLEIVNVRVERVQEISDQDAIAEGIGKEDGAWQSYGHLFNRCVSPVTSFMTLWDSIHGKGAWERNDWVWVVEFRKL